MKKLLTLTVSLGLAALCGLTSLAAGAPGSAREAAQVQTQGGNADMNVHTQEPRLNFNRDCGADWVLNDPGAGPILQRMKEAGVETLWLHGYFFGHYTATLEQLAEAKQVLEDLGFAVNIISVPAGHPTFSAGANNIPATWKNRVNVDGTPVYGCPCINDTMIEDNRLAAVKFAQLGFEKIFYDDDLRLGNVDGQIQGCFCDDCIAGFNAQNSLSVTRKKLQRAIASYERSRKFHDWCAAQLDSAGGVWAKLLNAVLVPLEKAVSKCEQKCKSHMLCESWMDYTCGKVLKFLQAVTVPGVTNGLMIMRDGDRRHGIDIPLLRREMPDLFFRVGEEYFVDAAFNTPEGKAALAKSIRGHLALVGDPALCYSETAMIECRLSPANFVEKMKIEIGLGLRNLFFMNGAEPMPTEYWDAIIAARPELLALAQAAAN